AGRLRSTSSSLSCRPVRSRNHRHSKPPRSPPHSRCALCREKVDAPSRRRSAPRRYYRESSKEPRSLPAKQTRLSNREEEILVAPKAAGFFQNAGTTAQTPAEDIAG